MLCFNAPTASELGVDQNLVAWKVIKVKKNQHGCATVKYSSRFGFGNSKLDEGNVVHGTIYTEVKEGQYVNLIPDAHQEATWSKAVNDPSIGQLVNAGNQTEFAQNLSIGIVSTSANLMIFEPTFLWKDVGPQQTIGAQFTPTVKCYFNMGYQENEYIRADITTKSVLDINLSALSAVSNFNLVETPQHQLKIDTVVFGH